MLVRWQESGDSHILEATKGESVQKGQAAVLRAKEVIKLRDRGAEDYPHTCPLKARSLCSGCGRDVARLPALHCRTHHRHR